MMTESTEKDFTATPEAELGKYKQSVPQLGAQRLRQFPGPGAISDATFLQLRESQLFDKGNAILCWLARFPIQNNHPRYLTGAVRTSVAGGEVMVVNPDEKLPRVCKKLETEGFLSCPVVDGGNRFLYFFGLPELVWHICNTFTSWQTETYPLGQQVEPSERRNRWATYFNLRLFLDTSIQDISDQCRQQPQIRTYDGFSTLSAIEAMIHTNSRRIALLRPNDKVKGILTLSMVISSFQQRLNDFGQLLDSTVDYMDRNCGIRKPLITVDEFETTINALDLMVTHNITSIAIVNRDKELVDVFSVRDLRGLGARAEHYERLWDTVRNFKRNMHQEFKRQTPSSPITVTRMDTFKNVVTKMDDGNIHHIYIVEAVSGKGNAVIPVGVLSQADVIQFVLYQCGMQLKITG